MHVGPVLHAAQVGESAGISVSGALTSLWSPGLGASAEAQAGVGGGAWPAAAASEGLVHRVSCLSYYQELCSDFMSLPGSPRVV